jgi:predicted metal-binding membrane protein
MSPLSALERLARHDSAITIAGLLTLCALAWLYIAAGAGLGMSAWEMTTQALAPQPHAGGTTAAMPGMGAAAAGASWSPADWGLMIGMWWVMMVAMMTPSATPAILLYARVHRHARAPDGERPALAPTGLFAAGYFLAWLGFSIAAAALHHALDQAGILSTTMGSQVRWISATVLVVTGAYQLSPLKHACLAHCRAPASFIARHWRPHALGALRLGLMHGAYCVGCCWMLMALLFVGGVMNLAWIAALSLLVLAEKVAPMGRWVGRGAGLVLIAWGLLVLA